MPGLLDTPFTNALYNNSNGLLAAASAINPQARTLAGAMRPAFGAFAQGQLVDEQMGQVRREEQERQAQMQQEQAMRERYTQFFTQQGRDDLARGVADGLFAPAEAYNEWMTAQSGAGDPSYSMTPVFMTDAQGNSKIGQMSSGGGIYVDGQVMSSLPQGWQITNRPQAMSNVDVGDQQLVFDPNTGTFRSGATIQGAPGTNMNVQGTGMDRVMAPAAGSPEALSREQEAEQAQMRNFLRQTYADIVTEDIDRVLDNIESNPAMNTGIGAALTQGIPGTPAFNTKQLTDTIRANVGFDRLQQMRDASPTGGALGQVSEFENRLLQATLGNLELSQDLPQLKRNLERVREVYFKIIHEGIRPGDPIAREIEGGQGQQPSGNTTSTGVQWSM